MLKKMSFFMGCFILVLPLLAHAFDCNKPDFGARIEALNKDGYFVKYMEKGGISYYNYTGACKMVFHNNINPAIAYAFIDNQLYARIMKISGVDENPEEVRKRMEDRVSEQFGASPMEKKLEGDWWIYQWYNEKSKIRRKIKINNKTNETKGAFYYEPLRAKLPNLNEDDDPVSLRH